MGVTMRRLRGVLLALLAVAAVIPAAAQGYSWCGQERYGVELRFHNPDLNPWNDPLPEDYPGENHPEVVEGSWHVFIQFQAVVDEDHEVAQDRGLLDAIESFWFGFGPIKEIAVAEPLDNCEKPWAPGIQLYSTFSDRTVEDGFHIGLNTTLVPDGTYGAIVYACTDTSEEECKPDGDDDLVAAAWSRVRIYNGEDQCAPKELSCMREYDFVKPWPRILPGDGEQVHEDVCDEVDRCLTIEFSEDVQDLQLTFNGIDVSDRVEPVPLESSDPTSRLGYSEMYKWEAPRPFETNDEIRVRAVDGAGNVAEKTISFRDDTRGAVVPRIDARVDVTVTPERQRVRPGETKVFEVRLANAGNDTAHIFPRIEAPPSVDARIADDHIDLGGGQNTTVALQAGPTVNASEGEHPIEVAFEYIAGHKRRSTKTFPTVVADGDARLAAREDGNGSTVESLPSGFTRQCRTTSGFEVCFVHPPTLVAGETFPFEAQVAEEAEQATQRHEVDAGNASLTLQLLEGPDGTEVAAEETYDMEQVSTGQYRADVTLGQLSPTVNAIFSSERIETSMLIREPAEPARTSGGEVPGFEVVAAVLAGLATAVWTRRDP